MSVERGFQFRNGIEQIGHKAEIRNLENRRFLILVDGDDDLAVLHTGKMLDGTRDADSDIQVGGDDLAGLANLVVVRNEAGICLLYTSPSPRDTA